MKADRRNISERIPSIKKLKEKLESASASSSSVSSTAAIPCIYALCVATCPTQLDGKEIAPSNELVNAILSMKVVPLLVNIPWHYLNHKISLKEFTNKQIFIFLRSKLI